MGTLEDQASICFGDFELQPGERRLLVRGHPAALGLRAFDLLLVLVERAGKLVSKRELIDRVWPNLVVEENNLQVHISALRKILGPEAIATIAGHGYRFTPELIRHDKAPAAPAVVVARAKHNLPQQLTSFVGRARERAEVKALLQRARLLTLVGFGGIGKTRLALEAATDVVGSDSHGVWFVELAPLTDARLVPQAVASVLGVREEPGRPVVEAVRNYVRDRHLLLVLDSCEHLLQACAEVAKELLQSGAQLKILATSRERLNLTGETTYPVPPLAMPAANSSIALGVLSEYEAVRLFLDRAAAVQPAFRLTDHNATAVADICRRVDGIPLAIELAAARVRALSAEKIAERLNDRFRLLTRGDPTALPHRQTLRALIDWSYELLTEPQRVVLRRLALFPGSFTLEAAEAVAAGGAIAAADVLDLLTDLIEKSLVVVEAEGERYRLLDTVHEYVRERLQESQEEDRARAQHLYFYVALAEEAQPKLAGPEQGAWFARLDLERENFLFAHASCSRTDGGAQLGLKLVWALMRYWMHRGGIELGYRIAVDALARAPERNLARCLAVGCAGQLGAAMGLQAKVRELYGNEGLSIAREIGNERQVTVSLLGLAQQSSEAGNQADARRYIEEAFPMARRLEDRSVLNDALLTLADLERIEGNLDVAEQLYEESLALARERGGLRDVVKGLINLSIVSITRASAPGVPERLLEALTLAERINSKPFAAYVLLVASALAAALGEWRRAAQLYGAGDAQCKQIGFQREPADEAFLAPLIAEVRDSIGASAYAAAEAAGRSLSYDAALSEAHAWLTAGQMADPSLSPNSSNT